MNNRFYMKFAFDNIKKNHQLYIPYLLSCVVVVSMFFIMQSLALSKEIKQTSGGGDFSIILYFAAIVTGIFAVILLFYTNSFLMKRRKKELGLYHILGMERKHILIMMFYETFLIFFGTLFIGYLFGIVFAKLMFLILIKLMFFQVTVTHILSSTAAIRTGLLFLFIFIGLYFFDAIQILKAKPVELLSAEKKGENEPKSKLVFTFFGFISLLIGYWLALSVKSPLQALYQFFIAIVLVIIGTYLLFISGSIVFLKLLKKKKSYYYKTQNFISVSMMIYRMKQNAIGLASICILSTAVILTIATTVSMYCGVEDVLSYKFPHELQVNLTNKTTDEERNVVQQLNENYSKYGLKAKNESQFRYGYCYGKYENHLIKITKGFSYNSNYNNQVYIQMIPLDEYNQITSKKVKLAQNEILLYCINGKKSNIPINNGFPLGNQKYKIKGSCKDLTLIDKSYSDYYTTYYIVLADEKQILDYSNISAQSEMEHLYFEYAADFTGSKTNLIAFTKDMKETVFYDNPNGINSKENRKEGFYALYGSLFFIGVFIGLLFLGATVLIIYYKQISEGFEDQNRFLMMQKIGLSNQEIRKTIQNQIMKVFALPIVFSMIHIFFAFSMMTKLLALFALKNVKLFFGCTIGTIFVFAIIYVLVYVTTAKTYYKLVYHKK